MQKGALDVQILMIGDFWDKGQKDEKKQKACEETGVEFISLDEIKGSEEYQRGMGTTDMTVKVIHILSNIQV